MNMPMRADESLLWLSFGSKAEHENPREAGRALGIAPRRVEYLCEKWARKGWYDYGVAHDLGWKVTQEPKDRETLAVDPAWIIQQRELGWPDMHPEDFCHRCGARNPSWCASAEDWATATAAWAAETGREGICCPACFQEMYEAATGNRTVIVVAPWRGTWTAHGVHQEPSEQEPNMEDKETR